MKTCNTCLYWSRSLEVVKNISDCDAPNSAPDKEMTFDVEVTADDDQGLDFVVKTSGNFGCLLHKPKK